MDDESVAKVQHSAKPVEHPSIAEIAARVRNMSDEQIIFMVTSANMGAEELEGNAIEGMSPMLSRTLARQAVGLCMLHMLEYQWGEAAELMVDGFIAVLLRDGWAKIRPDGEWELTGGKGTSFGQAPTEVT